MHRLLAILVLLVCVDAFSSSYSSITSNPGNMMNRSPAAAMRVELFFKNQAELQERLRLLHRHQISAVNLVNKHADDKLQDLIQNIGVGPNNDDNMMHCCVHYSLKYQKVKRGSVEQNVAKLEHFLSSTPREVEVLLVSGSTPSESWNTVKALQALAANSKKQSSSGRRKVAVAYNPYFPDEADRQLEWERLQQKIDTGLVGKIYLQFGADLSLAAQCLEDLKQHFSEIPVAASIFLPTKQLIAQQKFRPWKGVFLSQDDFLSGPDAARKTVVELLRLYKSHNVEVLVEAPGIRKEGDMNLLESLLEESSNGNDSKAKKEQDDESSNVYVVPASLPPPSPKRQKTGEEQRSHSEDFKNDVTSNRRQSSTAIVAFGSHDVRLHDNQALERAVQQHEHILTVFLWQPPGAAGTWGVQGAAQVVLKDALRHLATLLKEHYGLPLVCRNTLDDVQELRLLVQEVNAVAVYYNRAMTTEGRQRECRLARAMQKLEVRVVPCQCSLLYDIEKLELSKGFHGGHWGTLMPFLKACQKQLGQPLRPKPMSEVDAMLQRAKAPTIVPTGVSVEDLRLAIMPPKTRWDAPILKRFPMTYQAAQDRLHSFFQSGLAKYESERSRADKDLATSQLSVHLRLGTMSPYELYWKTQDSSLSDDQKKTFYRRLFWRDLAYFQLYYFPDMTDKSIREHYEKTLWLLGDEAEQRLEAWKKGQTGYPMVDAGMRELYKTGWMTQSVRMVVASFLVEYLRVDWKDGAKWFHETLVDADCAINSMMWQNAGRSGIDQWNFVLSPENASQDASGEYTRKWVPELSKLPKQYLHRPWKASNDVLRTAEVILGSTYPHRIVKELKAERAISVENVLQVRRDSQDRNDDKGYDLIRLPTGDDTVVFTKKEYRIDRAGDCIEPGSDKLTKPKRMKSKQRGRARTR